MKFLFLFLFCYFDHRIIRATSPDCNECNCNFSGDKFAECIGDVNDEVRFPSNLISLRIDNGCLLVSDLPSSLQELFISHCRLSSDYLQRILSGISIGSLKRLSVVHSNLSLHSLKHFSNSTWFRGLEEINLSGNEFVQFDASLLPSSLRSLRLIKNQKLKRIVFSKSDFYFSNLTVLELHDNPNLEIICSVFLSHSPALTTVSLNHTSLRMFPFVGSAFKHLLPTDLPDKELLCDCDLPFYHTISRFPDLKCILPNKNAVAVENVNLYLYCNKTAQGPVPLIRPDEKKIDLRSSVSLDCDFKNFKILEWITPQNRIFRYWKDCNHTHEVYCGTLFDEDMRNNFQLLSNGTLIVRDFNLYNRGMYRCTGINTRGNFSLSTQIQVDPDFRILHYHYSLIYGFSTAGGFLLLTLIFKLVHFLLHNYGCCLCCCCCKDRLPPKAKKLKNALDSIEAYRTQQLERLKENYNQQNEWIRDNCALQMERVRENYNNQVQNLKNIHQFGTSQLAAVRSQYFDQMQKIRDYSTSQLNRLHENYVFQRQRLCKFSAQNHLKIRETKKYTQRTLNKVIDNIPALYLDLSTCRQGLGERQDSIVWDSKDIQALELNQVHRDRLHRESTNGDSDSLYFTPSGTPVRDVVGRIQSQKNTPVREPNPYKDVYSASTLESQGKRSRIKSKSFSNFLPVWKNGVKSTMETKAVIEKENKEGDYIPVEKKEEPEVDKPAEC